MIELQTTATIITLRMGADVPEWLLQLEPRTDIPPGASKRGNFRFATDVDVIDLPDYYIILPRSHGFNHLLDTEGTLGCTLWAATKDVHIVQAWHSVAPHEVKGEMTPFQAIPGFQAGAPPAAVQALAAAQRQVAAQQAANYLQNQPGGQNAPGAGPVLNPQGRRPWWKRLFSAGEGR